MKKALKYILSLLVVALIVYLTRDTWHQINRLKNIGFFEFFIVSVLFLSIQIINGLKLRTVLNVFQVTLSFKEWFGLISIRSLGNYLALSAGSVYNGIYLKKNQNLSYSNFITTYSTNILFLLLSTGIWGVILLVLKFLITNDINLTLLFVFISFLFLCLIILHIPIPQIKNSNLLFDTLNNIRNGWFFVKKQRRTLFRLFILNSLTIPLLGLRFYFLFQFLNYDFSLLDTLLAILLVPVLNIFTLLPGNIGIRESIIGGTTSLLNISFDSGFFGGMIDRIITMFWIFLLGIIFSFILTGGKKVLVEEPK